MTILNFWTYDKTKKLKLWQHSTNKIVAKLLNLNGNKTSCYITQIVREKNKIKKLWKNLYTKSVKTLKRSNSNCDQTQKLRPWQNSNGNHNKTKKNIFSPPQNSKTQNMAKF